MMTKRNVFFITLTTTGILVALFFIDQIRYCHYDYDGYETWCMHVLDYIWHILKPVGFALFLAPFIFLLSLITYKLRDDVFRAWWGFVRWWSLIIIAVTIGLSNLSGGGTLGMNNDFTAFILIILYSILGIVSLVKIVRAYFATRR